MKIAEYAGYDATGLAALVAKGEVTAKELALTAAEAIAAANPKVNAVVETYADRIEGLDEKTLQDGPFRGVPFLIKDIGQHLDGRKFECGSRLMQGFVVEGDSHVGKLFKEAQAEMGSDEKGAREKLKQVQQMVDSKSQWHQKAGKLLSGG